MNLRPSIEHSYLAARHVKSLILAKDSLEDELPHLHKLGIGLDAYTIRKMLQSAMDAIEPAITTASIVTPIQFLQAWLPGFVRTITAPRLIDELIGLTVVGDWEDAEVVQGVLEIDGTSVPYGDYTETPLSSWNANFERRSIVRFEEGMREGVLEERVAAKINLNSAAEKRASAALALEIQRNRIGFFGYNNGNNRVYGFLTDPALPAYVTLPNGASGFPTWITKTFLEITADIRNAVRTVRLQSLDAINPKEINLTLALPTTVVDFLTTTTDLGGVSVQDWLTKAYPKIRVVSAPELDAANGGANVFYLYADRITDGSTDDGRVFSQNVPTKFMLVGVERKAKAYIESYSNATAGTLCKRPFAVARFTGC